MAEGDGTADLRVLRSARKDFRRLHRVNGKDESVQIREIFRAQTVCVSTQLGGIQSIVNLVRFRAQQRRGAGYVCINSRSAVKGPERSPFTVEHAELGTMSSRDRMPAMGTDAGGTDAAIRRQFPSCKCHRCDEIDAVSLIDVTISLRDRRPHPWSLGACRFIPQLGHTCAEIRDVAEQLGRNPEIAIMCRVVRRKSLHLLSDFYYRMTTKYGKGFSLVGETGDDLDESPPRGDDLGIELVEATAHEEAASIARSRSSALSGSRPAPAKASSMP